MTMGESVDVRCKGEYVVQVMTARGVRPARTVSGAREACAIRPRRVRRSLFVPRRWIFRGTHTRFSVGVCAAPTCVRCSSLMKGSHMNASLSDHGEHDFNYRSSSEPERRQNPPSQARRSKHLARGLPGNTIVCANVSVCARRMKRKRREPSETTLFRRRLVLRRGVFVWRDRGTEHLDTPYIPLLEGVR